MLVCKKCQRVIPEDAPYEMQLRCLYCGERTILGKVIAIATTKEDLPLSHRGLLNIEGVYCQSRPSLQFRMTPEGALGYGVVIYLAGTKLTPKLQFAVTHPSYELSIQHYEPGGWEGKIDLAYKEVEKTADWSEKIIEATKKRDEKSYSEIIAEMSGSLIGSALLQKYEDGYRKAKKGKIRCPACKAKIDERHFLIPLSTIYCPRCGMFINW